MKTKLINNPKTEHIKELIILTNDQFILITITIKRCIRIYKKKKKNLISTANERTEREAFEQHVEIYFFNLSKFWHQCLRDGFLKKAIFFFFFFFL